MKARCLLLYLLLCLLAFSALPLLAIDGVVINASSGKPQAGVELSLVQPSQEGMVPLGNTVSGADGSFKIDKTIPPGPGLLQATFQGNTYNQIFTPGTPTTGVQVKVFESTNDPIVANPAEHLILLEPGDTEIKVSETFVFNNQTVRTFSDPAKGSLQFFLPAAAGGKSRAIITAPGGMPIPRVPVKATRPGFYKIDYPIKPGETRMDINYSVPAAQKFAGKIVLAPAGTHLVTPFSVTLTGSGIESQGQEPQTQAHLYSVTGTDYEITIDGTGALRNTTSTAAEGGAVGSNANEDNGQPKIEIASARVYSKLPWVLGLAFGILTLGGTMLFRRVTP